MECTTYRIGRMAPAQVLDYAHFLKTAAVNPAVPTYVKVVRSGRSRERKRQIFQVMPGFIFIPEHEATRAEATLAQIGRRLNWMRDHLTQDHARCSIDELRPVFEWGKTFTDDGPMPNELRQLAVGQTVAITGGPLQGFSGMVVRGEPLESSHHVQIEINGMAGMKVTIPVELLESAK